MSNIVPARLLYSGGAACSVCDEPLILDDEGKPCEHDIVRCVINLCNRIESLESQGAGDE